MTKTDDALSNPNIGEVWVKRLEREMLVWLEQAWDESPEGIQVGANVYCFLNKDKHQ